MKLGWGTDPYDFRAHTINTLFIVCQSSLLLTAKSHLKVKYREQKNNAETIKPVFPACLF